VRQTLTMLLVVAVLGACGSDDKAGLDWPKTDHIVGAAGVGLVWADRKTGDIHLPDGSTLAAGQSIRSFVVAGDGAYVVDPDDHALIEVTAGGARVTGAHVDQQVKASPNGRYLAFIDPAAGPKFKGVGHQLTSVVVDLKTGNEVFRSTRGMGNPKKDDLTDLYEDASHQVLGITNKTAWIEPPIGDVLAIDLASGQVTTAPDDDTGNQINPWVRPKVPPEPVGGDWNPDRSWGIKHVRVHDPKVDPEPANRQARDIFVKADGSQLVPRPAAVNWSFDRWLNPTTVVGFADQNLEDPDNPDDRLPSSVLTCTVPDGNCTLLPDSDNAILPEPSLY
jgi:hypothetical protein